MPNRAGFSATGGLALSVRCSVVPAFTLYISSMSERASNGGLAGQPAGGGAGCMAGHVTW
eukprot:CAMPEP_0173173552 /NCGR_PEP_ID=MMETSP1141-20130122/2889_1 /TAXON_ID=483371 /ORGANISM="non described non described, Strain CCMP2298" /LENGTH=59 /DNA_ID=CAMNT_0014095635 /DNA_START=533 /DNA_END=709 /DNA_ORIENTATION=+